MLKRRHTARLTGAICAIGPAVPNNEGSFRPVAVKAPEGSILNCTFPAAVGARHLVGHFLSQVIFGALAQALPERVIADGSAGLWNSQFEGRDQDGRVFAYIFFSAGGMGARPGADGLSATAFPSGIRGVPAEAIEAVSSILIHRRALRPDSGGAGKFRGGLGQEMVLEVRGQGSAFALVHVQTGPFTRSGASTAAWTGPRASCFCRRESPLHPQSKYLLRPGESVTLRLPGGYGPARQREPHRVLEDVRQELVSVEAAKALYGVVIDTETWTVDEAGTAALRKAKA